MREELSMKWGEKYFRNSILRKGILEMTKFERVMEMAWKDKNKS